MQNQQARGRATACCMPAGPLSISAWGWAEASAADINVIFRNHSKPGLIPEKINPTAFQSMPRAQLASCFRMMLEVEPAWTPPPGSPDLCTQGEGLGGIPCG